MRGAISVGLFNKFMYRNLSKKKALFGSSWPTMFITSRFIISPPLTSIDFSDVWTNSSTISSIVISGKVGKMQMAKVIEGKTIANEIKSRIAGEIQEMKSSIGKVPGLGVVIVGKRNDSHVFVDIKLKACDRVGIASFKAELAEDCSEDEALDVVRKFNENPSIHGVIVQLPLPKQINEEKIMSAVSAEKDVDGFHPLNMGNLAIRGREPLFIPCAAKCCMELLTRYGVEIKGKRVAILGRSKIVGLPTSLLLQRHHATVSVIHSFTENPERLTSEADIVVSDIGVPNLVRGHWLKQGAFVIDMGTNSIKDPNTEHGYHLVGDVCYDEAITKVSAITPVPGGVGPVTISMLLANTLDSAKRAYKLT